MGAPKQKWTSEEESALKAGISKHGTGKWRTILKDPEFSSILSLRSNVDLKDKWRNMSVTANGWGSRDRARIALRRPPTTHHQHQHMMNSNISRSDDDDLDYMSEDTSQEEVDDDDLEESDDADADGIVDANPISVAPLQQIAAAPPPSTPKQPTSRLESLVIEAITTLKEPSGSNKTNIAMYIEDQYNTPPNFKKILSAKLKGLTASGKLIKVNRKYRIAPSASFSQAKRTSGVLLLEGRNRDSIRIEKDDMRNLMKTQIDAELAKMRTMNVQDAAAAAAQAVKEAEAAMAEAEEAAREAEAAEAEADAAQAFADAAMTTLKNRYPNNLMVHG